MITVEFKKSDRSYYFLITLDSSSLVLFRQKKPILYIPKKAAYELSRGCWINLKTLLD